MIFHVSSITTIQIPKTQQVTSNVTRNARVGVWLTVALTLDS
jgi:hypothetical protein